MENKKEDYKKIRIDIINGKKRCIYIKPKGKREYVKSKGEFVLLSVYIKKMQKKIKIKGGDDSDEVISNEDYNKLLTQLEDGICETNGNISDGKDITVEQNNKLLKYIRNDKEQIKHLNAIQSKRHDFPKDPWMSTPFNYSYSKAFPRSTAEKRSFLNSITNRLNNREDIHIAHKDAVDGKSAPTLLKINGACLNFVLLPPEDYGEMIWWQVKYRLNYYKQLVKLLRNEIRIKEFDIKKNIMSKSISRSKTTAS